MKSLRISKSYQKLMPSNCPIIEKTADGMEVGICTFFLRDGKTCPRHGEVSKHIKAELLERIKNYLEVGGLFNPELMEHDKVRRLIIDCREYINSTH